MDDSILHFKFDKGIHATFKYKFEEFLSEMSGTPLKELKMTLKRKNFKTYYLESSFEITFENNYEFAKAFVEYDNDIVDYLEPLFRKMRLYKAGNIWFSDRYSYFMQDDKPKLYHATKDHRFLQNELYHIETDEINDLTYFLKDFDLPFDDKSLNLAFENFELSYHVEFMYLQFLSLMNSLEVLVKPVSAKTDLTYRLSRNTAVLLGKDRKESNEIYKNLKCLYTIRSSIVHTGEAKECKKKGKVLNYEQMLEKIITLRGYVRNSIKEMNYIIKNENKNKDQALNMLNECGFGERPWREH